MTPFILYSWFFDKDDKEYDIIKYLTNLNMENLPPCLKCDIDYKTCKNFTKALKPGTFTATFTIAEQCKYYDEYMVIRNQYDEVVKNLIQKIKEKENAK